MIGALQENINAAAQAKQQNVPRATSFAPMPGPPAAVVGAELGQLLTMAQEMKQTQEAQAKELAELAKMKEDILANEGAGLMQQPLIGPGSNMIVQTNTYVSNSPRLTPEQLAGQAP